MCRLPHAFCAAILAVTLAPAVAQWVHYPDPRVPKTRDGKPNLSGSAPKTQDGKPDLTGVWAVASNKYLANLAWDGVDVPFQPWAKTLYMERRETESKDKPAGRCLPHGVPDAMLVQVVPFKILQMPGEVAILYEVFNHFRQIFTDGRPLPKVTVPAWMGYSVGKWTGDTLAVDTIGFNDQSWLDDGGHPHSDALRTTERFRRLDFGHMEMQITIDDPKTYTKPWSVTIPFNLQPDTELMEMICEENEKDAPHMVGK